ncbi:protein ECERIFERUM 2-like [Malania oleifera]|uniref:protein ECERIFERUM 2-like n=1 Tax=Malania oleifera TaxID=397392 RepID=UPI0025ADC8FE|nr:protein ECERIFERUM 2-like [Malania oleifera]
MVVSSSAGEGEGGEVMEVIVKMSSTVPSRVTGEDKVHEFRNIDLAMKLHYLHGLYFFQNDAVRGLHVNDFKDPTFPWLDIFCMTPGRIRRHSAPDGSSSSSGRPFLKCNDSGIRYAEARCNYALHDCMAAVGRDPSLRYRLIAGEPLGPHLFFSPLIYLQITWFKCGGVSMGLSWAHILGDAFSATTYMNLFGQFISGYHPEWTLRPSITGQSKSHSPVHKNPLSVKRVDPVGDCWVTANNCKMETHSFHVTATQLETLQQPKIGGPFEILSAVVWKSLAKIREDSGPRVVTICESNSPDRENEIPSNGQSLRVVEADFSVGKADLAVLGKLISEKRADENCMIEEMMERENGNVDLVVYGANLTFVNLENAKVYGMEIRGHKPVLASYYFDGVGDEGVVLLLPMLENGEGGGGSGWMLTVTLPQNQLAELKDELKREWGIN